MDSVLCPMIRVYILEPWSPNIQTGIFLTSTLNFPKGSPLLRFLQLDFLHIISFPTRVICLVHYNMFYLNILKILSVEKHYKSLGIQFPQFPCHFLFLRSKYFPTFRSETPSLRNNKFHIHTKQRVKHFLVYFNL
jgi:hypothetical protein